MPGITDENSGVTGGMMTRSKGRRLSGPGAAFRPLEPTNGVDKPNKGSKRAALGDVTNQQLQRHGLSAKLKQQQQDSVVVVAATASHDDADAAAPASPEMLLQKPSPMCISSNLKDMSLNKRKRLYDIDSADVGVEASVWQYAEDMYTHFLTMEKYRMAEPAYMDAQQDINSKMRSILIDWLVDVHFKYQMDPQTLHMTIGLIDRYLSKEVTIRRQRLQLVGITALFVAAKYEEIYPPEVYEFVRITDNAYTVEDVFEMEEQMLKMLQYYVTAPTAYQFLTRFLKAAGSPSDQTRCFALYVIDRALQEYRLLAYPPSVVAAAAVHIARSQMSVRPTWHSTLEHHTTYSESCIALCIRDIKEIIWSAQNGIKSNKLTAVKRKYTKEEFCEVSLIQLCDN